MNKNTYTILFGALLFGLLINSVFIVNEKEKAIVFQFGEAVRQIIFDLFFFDIIFLILFNISSLLYFYVF